MLSTNWSWLIRAKAATATHNYENVFTTSYNLPTFLVSISSLSSRLKEASGLGEGAFTTCDTGGGVVSLRGGVVSFGGGVGSFGGGLISFCGCFSTGDTTLAGDGDLKPFAVL